MWCLIAFTELVARETRRVQIVEKQLSSPELYVRFVLINLLLFCAVFCIDHCLFFCTPLLRFTTSDYSFGIFIFIFLYFLTVCVNNYHLHEECEDNYTIKKNIILRICTFGYGKLSFQLSFVYDIFCGEADITLEFSVVHLFGTVNTVRFHLCVWSRELYSSTSIQLVLNNNPLLTQYYNFFRRLINNNYVNQINGTSKCM